MIFPGYWPTGNRSSTTTPYGTLDFGGNPAGYAQANADCGPKVLKLLHDATDGGNSPAGKP